MDCRGRNTRIAALVECYDMNPVAHVQLLKGQVKKSCTGIKLSDTYYYFIYVSRADGKKGCFFCGSHSGTHFLELIKSPPIPLFNPLKAASGGVGGQHNPEAKKGQWNPVAKQLYNAINLVTVCWNSPPGYILAEIKLKVEKHYKDQPHEFQIKAVNTIISKDPRKCSLQDMIAKLRIQHAVKEYDFSLLNEILDKMGIVSKFG